MANSNSIIELGVKFLRSEVQALEQLTERIHDSFSDAINAMLKCQGTVVLSGVGKPYFVAQKISASMASTGTRSIALHPVDALHGDMGRISSGDVVIALSNSGASREMVEFVQATRGLDVTLVAMTCRPKSAMADLCDIVLDLGPLEEACPMGVAPSTTSTAMLALGDALTLTLVELRGFTIDSFARNHPGGSLGKRLRSVSGLMRSLARSATVGPHHSVLETLGIIAEKRCGAAFVVNESGELLGVFTDGDVKRLLTAQERNLSGAIEHSMTRGPKTISGDQTAEVALDMLRAHQINCLAVVDCANIFLGHLDIQDVA